MTKVILTKSDPTISLSGTNRDAAEGEITIRTEWDSNPDGIDLDLGVMWKGRRGVLKGCVQALGEHQGSTWMLPYLRLDGDDRRGGKGETIRGSYKKVLRSVGWFGVYLYVYGGASSIASVRDAVTTITIPGFDPVVVHHEDQYGLSTAILQATNIGNGFEIKRDSRAFSGTQTDLDRYWGVGLHWAAARK